MSRSLIMIVGMMVAFGGRSFAAEATQETKAVATASQELPAKVGVFALTESKLQLRVTIADGQPDGPQGIPLNRLTSLQIKVTDNAGQVPTAPVTDLVFDARMPDHNHGMMVTPKVRAIAPNEFRVDGVKLHMAGDWELHFTLKHGDQLLKIREPFVL